MRRRRQREVLLLQDLLHVHGEARHALPGEIPGYGGVRVYIDVRTPGKNFDEFYRRAVEEYGVHYIKGQVGKVVPQNGKLWSRLRICWKTGSCTWRRIW